MVNKLPKPKASVVVEGHYMRACFGDLTEWPEGTTKLYSEEQVLAAMRESYGDAAGAEPLWKPEDLIISTWRSGAGAYNTLPDNCCRIVHRPTGLTVEVIGERSIHKTKAEAMLKLEVALAEHDKKKGIDKTLPLIIRAIAALNTRHVTPTTMGYVNVQLRELRKLCK